MQANTHFLVAVFFIKILENLWISPIPWLQIVVFSLVAFLSHLLLDFLVKFTYHPANAKPKDKFWVGYHIYSYILMMVIFIWLFNPYWWVMLISVMVDIIDWLILRAIFRIPTERTWFHPWIMRIRDTYFAWIPDRTEINASCIPEFIITGLLIWAIIVL